MAADDGAAVVVRSDCCAAAVRDGGWLMGAAARALLLATLRSRWCALSLCQRLLAIAADYCSALLRAALVAVAVTWFTVAACCSQESSACSARCGALKSQNGTHCLNAQQWHSAATDKSNARLIVRLRLSNAGGQPVAVVRVRRVRPTLGGLHSTLSSAPARLDARRRDPVLWKRAIIWCVDGLRASNAAHTHAVAARRCGTSAFLLIYTFVSETARSNVLRARFLACKSILRAVCAAKSIRDVISSLQKVVLIFSNKLY